MSCRFQWWAWYLMCFASLKIPSLFRCTLSSPNLLKQDDFLNPDLSLNKNRFFSVDIKLTNEYLEGILDKKILMSFITLFLAKLSLGKMFMILIFAAGAHEWSDWIRLSIERLVLSVMGYLLGFRNLQKA